MRRPTSVFINYGVYFADSRNKERFFGKWDWRIPKNKNGTKNKLSSNPIVKVAPQGNHRCINSIYNQRCNVD